MLVLPQYFWARLADFCWSWSSKPTEFLCVTQQGDNLNQQKDWEDQLNQSSVPSAVWSGSTLFAILSASFGHITVW